MAQAELQSVAVSKKGQELFLKYCASCHGKGGMGNGPVAKALKTRPADLSLIARRNGGTFPSSVVAEYIDGSRSPEAHGSREMPIWGEKLRGGYADPGLGEEMARGTITAIVEYLQTIQATK